MKTATPLMALNLKTTGRVIAITVGLPGSGKTWWALGAGFDRAICLDDWREKLWGSRSIQDGPGGLPLLVVKQHQEIDEAMRNGGSIVVHNTNILKQHRKPLVDMARKAGYHSHIVFFDVPVETCRRQNQNRENPVPDAVIDDFAERMEPPGPEEADLVIRYSDLTSA